MRASVAAGVFLVLLLVAAQAGADTTLSFSNDEWGSKPNGWGSVDCGLVTFSDSNGEGLEVWDYSPQSFGPALAVYDDWDDSWLIMDFAMPMIGIELWFGNDDPGWSSEGDTADLSLFYGGSWVTTVSVPMNRNDLMDQSIGAWGYTFDRATFYYNVDPSEGLIEIVDDITFKAAPEPTTLALLLAAGAPLAIRKLRRRA